MACDHHRLRLATNWAWSNLPRLDDRHWIVVDGQLERCSSRLVFLLEAMQLLRARLPTQNRSTVGAMQVNRVGEVRNRLRSGCDLLRSIPLVVNDANSGVRYVKLVG